MDKGETDIYGQMSQETHQATEKERGGKNDSLGGESNLSQTCFFGFVFRLLKGSLQQMYGQRSAGYQQDGQTHT
jgi:hypothetical protein